MAKTTVQMDLTKTIVVIYPTNALDLDVVALFFKINSVMKGPLFTFSNKKKNENILLFLIITNNAPGHFPITVNQGWPFNF